MLLSTAQHMGVQFTFVMPSKAGIQAFFLDSRYRHAGMTYGDNGHFILWRCTKDLSVNSYSFSPGDDGASQVDQC
jgi:hypothetical protein